MTRFLSMVLVSAFLFSAPVHAQQGPFPSELRSYIAVTKSKNGDNNFVFLACSGGICEPVGSTIGYTKEQILSMSGSLKKWLGIGVGILEAVVVVGGAAVSVPLVATAGAEYLMILTPATIAGGSGTAIYFIDAINPYEIYRNGATEQEMMVAVKKMMGMVNATEAAVSIYASPNLQEILDVKARMEKILQRFN